MKTWLRRLVGVAVVVQAGVVWAGESPWTLRLGASYRDFDDVDFNAAGFRNWGQSNTAGPYGVQNVMTVNGNPVDAPVILDYVRWDGGSGGADSSDSFAPVIGFRYDLTPTCKIRLALVGNFQYYQLGVDSAAAGTVAAPRTFTVQQYQHWWLDTNLGGEGDTLSPGVLLDGVLPGTTFAIRNEFDMDLYVLDLGLEVRTTMDRVNFTFALGPSLTIADAESSQTQRASWAEQGPGLPAGNYVQEVSQSDTDFLLGAYAALGVTVDITKSWSVGLQYRYDYVSEDAGTSQAELDLSGSSGVLWLGYQF